MDQHVDEAIHLPPGFRFHPTDEEIITHYLTPKALSPGFTSSAIGDVDLNKSEPWDLPGKAKMGEKEWYFFCQRDRKYPTGMRTNRATEAGYWKATGKDKEIFRGRGGGVLVGMKKTLVFYTGRAPKGDKTNWVMHEFRVEGKPVHPNLARPASKNEWVVCKVFNKDMFGAKKSPMQEVAGIANEDQFGFGGDLPLVCSPSSLPTLMDPTCFNSYAAGGGTTKPPLPSYFSTMGDLQEPPYKTPSYPPQTPYFPLAGIPYLHQNDALLSSPTHVSASPAIRRHCKMEQFSTSQDTGLSTDRNTEISSRNSGFDFEDAIDLDNFWNYQY